MVLKELSRGSTMQENYINGIKHGLEFVLHPNGKKIKESQYNKGKHIKSIHFNKD